MSLLRNADLPQHHMRQGHFGDMDISQLPSGSNANETFIQSGSINDPEWITAYPVDLRDEGQHKGRIWAIDLRGTPVSATVSSGLATVTISGTGGGGDHSHEPPTPGVHKVLVKRTTNFSSTPSNDSIPDYDTVIEDTMTDSWWDVGDPDRLIVTADYDGLDVIFTASVAAADLGTSEYLEMKMYLFPTGSDPRPIGVGTEDNLLKVEQQPAQDNVNHFISVISDPVTVSTGDQIMVALRTEDAQTLITYNGRVAITLGAYIVGTPGPEGPEGPAGSLDTVREVGGSDIQPTSELEFDASDFIVSDQGGGTARVELTNAGGGSAPASARYVRSGSNYTTSSATFVDIDSTNMSLTIDIGPHPVQCMFWGATFVNNAAGEVAFDIMVDGVAQGSTFGLQYLQQHATASEGMNPSFNYLTDTLTSGSHTIKMQWRVGNAAHTATLYGGTGGINSGFAVVEVA